MRNPVSYVRSHYKRVIVALIVAVISVASITTLASEGSTNPDFIRIESPLNGAIVTNDFPIKVTYKPRVCRSSWTMRMYIDGKEISSEPRLGAPVTERQSIQYTYAGGSSYQVASLPVGTHWVKAEVSSTEENISQRCGAPGSVKQGTEKVLNSATSRIKVER